MLLRRYKYTVSKGAHKIKTKTAIVLSSVGLLMGGGSGLAIATFSTAHADTGTVVVTPSDLQGWGVADREGGAGYAYVTDATSPYPSGALQLTTDGSNGSKLQYMHGTDVALKDVTALGYSTKQVSGPATADPSYQLAVDLNGDAAGGFTTLVYEPYWNGSVTNGNWQTWDVAADTAQLWSSASFSDGTCSVEAGHGGTPFYSLADLQANCPDAVVQGFGVNVGTYNLNYNVETDGVVFNDTTYNFERTTASGAIVSPTANEHVSGTLTLAATYDDGDMPNTDDGVQWAVRQGTCTAGTDTVFGNVDGHSDAYSWNGNSFSASLDVRNVTPGEYCFVFNPTDDPGQPNVRVTQTFYIDQFYAQAKNDCKNNGWMTLHDSSDNSFKNQGQCVSFTNHNDGVGQDDSHARNR